MIARRRALLVSGVAVLALSVGVQGWAEDATRVEIELEGHGGRTAGRPPAGCATAPVLGIGYAGGGGRVRWRPRVSTAHPERGPEVVASGVVEHHTFDVVSPGSGGVRDVPPDRTFAAGSLSAGYTWHGFGIRGGATVFEAISGASIECPDGRTTSTGGVMVPCTPRALYGPPRLMVLPELHLRIGPVEDLHVELGWGPYSIATTARPGVHVGFVIPLPARWQIALRGGYHYSTLNDLHPRGDLSLHIPVHRRLRIEVGGALGGGAAGFVGGEGRVAAQVCF